MPIPERGRTDRVIVIDASQSQSEESLHAEAALARAVLRSMDETERFALLACDSACAAFPEDGLAVATAVRRLGARELSRHAVRFLGREEVVRDEFLLAEVRFGICERIGVEIGGGRVWADQRVVAAR